MNKFIFARENNLVTYISLYTIAGMYYTHWQNISSPIGNNAIDFLARKKLWSEGVLRIPSLKEWILQDVKLSSSGVCYEYVDENHKLISAWWLEFLIKLSYKDKDIYIIDNHNHAFACRWRSYFSWILWRSSHLIHIDQHSDYAEPFQYIADFCKDINSDIDQHIIDVYTNEILTIASFIKPALACGFCSSHDMILSESALLEYDISHSHSTNRSIILDIDLDFRAPEMSTEYYDKTISIVKSMISFSQVKCITIATSPTYINQERALDILNDILL